MTKTSRSESNLTLPLNTTLPSFGVVNHSKPKFHDLPFEMVCEIAAKMELKDFMSFSQINMVCFGCRSNVGVVAQVFLNTFGVEALAAATRRLPDSCPEVDISQVGKPILLDSLNDFATFSPNIGSLNVFKLLLQDPRVDPAADR